MSLTVAPHQVAFIRSQQARAGLTQLQKWVEDGTCWRLEGSVGRAAMDGLKSGRLFLGEQRHTDAWGSVVPSRTDVKPGTTGSLSLSLSYWINAELDTVDEEGEDDPAEHDSNGEA